MIVNLWKNDSSSYYCIIYTYSMGNSIDATTKVWELNNITPVLSTSVSVGN